MASAYARPSRRGGACGLARRLQHDLSARRIHRGRASQPPTDKQEFRAACIDTITASYFRHGAIGSAPAYRGLSAGMHPAAALAARGRSAEDPGVVAAAFVPVALGLLALILMVAAVQTVGAAILPGCLGYRGLSRAAVLKVRIHLPPAGSLQTLGPSPLLCPGRIHEEPRVRIHLPVLSGIKKTLSFQPFLTRGETSFVPDFVPKRTHKSRVQGPTFRLGGESRIFFPKPPNSVKHVKGYISKVLWHSVGMPHDCIVPPEPRNPSRADDYRLLAIREMPVPLGWPRPIGTCPTCAPLSRTRRSH